MKMKLSLSAALAHHPKLLILDEATSSVDTRTELHIQEAMLALMEGQDQSDYRPPAFHRAER